jgi:WD40 repeat protein
MSSLLPAAGRQNLAISWFLACVLGSITSAGEPIPINEQPQNKPVSFESDILPILKRNCLACHSAAEKQGGLVLESPQAILQGGDTGPAVVPGRGAESLMLTLAAHQSDPIMPPEENDVAAANFNPMELGLLKNWIDQGAKGSSGFDSLSPKQWHPLPQGVHPVQAIALTADGQFVACSRANQIFLYHVPTGQLITKLADASLDTEQTTGIAHRDLVQSLAFNQAGDLLASGGFREVKLWRRPKDVQQFNIDLGAPAKAFAISPDQERIAVATTDHQIHIYSANNGEPGPVLAGHTDAITSLRFTNDGEQLVSVSLDQSARIWGLKDASLHGILTTPTSINAVELVNESEPTDEAPYPRQRIVTAHTENMIGVWTFPASSEPTTLTWEDADARLSGHSKAVTSLAADPKRAQHVYSGSLDGKIHCWNLENGRTVQQFNHGGPVTAITISPDGTRIASASENARAKLFRSNGQQIAEMRGDIRAQMNQARAKQRLNSANARVNAAKRLLDEAEKDIPKKTEAEKTLTEALAKANKEVESKQQAVDKTMNEKLAAEKAAIQASVAANNGLTKQEEAERLAREAAEALRIAEAKLPRMQRIAAANPENESLQQILAVAKQNAADYQQQSQDLTKAIEATKQAALALAKAANLAAVKASAVQKPFNDATAELKTAQSAQNLLSQQHALATKERTEAQQLVPVRQALMKRSEIAKSTAEQSLASAEESMQAAEQAIRSIAFSADGTLLASGGDFEHIHTWDGQTGDSIAAFAGHQSPVQQVGFASDGSIFSISVDQTCRRWTTNPNWVLERTIGDYQDSSIIAHRATAVDFNRDSSQVLVAGGVPSRSGELQVFQVADGQRILYLPRAHEDVIYAARFSPSGQRIATGGADKYLRTFDVAKSEQVRQFEGHTNYVLGVAWKSDGETIASAAADNTIKLWQTETGDQQRTINQQLTKHVTAVNFIGDTGDIISSSGDRRVRSHRGSNGGIARNFSQAKAWLHCVAVTPDNTVVAAGDAGGTVTIWNGTNGQTLHELEVKRDPAD